MEIISREYSSLIFNASLIRNRSDYEDFYICSVTDTENLVSEAAAFLAEVRRYLEERYSEK